MPSAQYIGTMGGVKLYNIVDPKNVTGRNGSTVSEKTLRKLGIRVPSSSPAGGFSTRAKRRGATLKGRE